MRIKTLIISLALVLAAPSVMAQSGSKPVEVTDYECSDGWIYTGYMANGQRNGEGIAVTKKGNVYTGFWKDNRLDRGILRAISGENESVYEGPFNRNMAPDGFGAMKYEKGKDAGCEYIGNFRNGMKHGIGKFVRHNGKMEFGEWKNGVIVKPKGQRFQPGDVAYGIDLSHFNPNINWDRLALYANSAGEVYKIRPRTRAYLQPVSFVYIRATEGATVKDRLYGEHKLQASRHFIPHGSYHLMAFTSSSVQSQIDNFLKTTNNCEGDELPPVLDLESGQAKQAGKVKVMKMVMQWLKAVEKATGRKPIIYTNDRFANKYLDMHKLKGYTIWKASYGQNGKHEKKEPLKPYDIWQFTHHGVAQGISPVDINVYRGSVKEFNKKFMKKK